MKKKLFGLVLITASLFVGTTAIASEGCWYGFLSSCGHEAYIYAPCGLSDDALIRIFDRIEAECVDE